ncbi:MAG: hypothetical protein ACW97Z_18120, partial [Candidatus Hodarchaeales archaeon]
MTRSKLKLYTINNKIILLILCSLLFSVITITMGGKSDTSIIDRTKTSPYQTTALTGSVAVIQDEPIGPYPNGGLIDILEFHSINYDIIKSNELIVTDLSPYEKVIVAGGQSAGFASNLTSAEMQALEDFVSGGGNALILIDNDAFGTLPGGGTYDGTPDETIVEIDNSHPVLNVPNVISVTDLQNQGPSAVGFVTDLPAGSSIVLENSAMAPILYETDIGSGNIMVSTIPLERLYGTGISVLFENAILFTPALKDTTNPEVTSPDDTIIEFGSAGNFLHWTPTDEYPGTYEIFRNSTSVSQGNWINNTELQYSIDGLSVGIYNFEIAVKDIAGNSVTDPVTVWVVDSMPPTLSSPSNVT